MSPADQRDGAEAEHGECRRLGYPDQCRDSRSVGGEIQMPVDTSIEIRNPGLRVRPLVVVRVGRRWCNVRQNHADIGGGHPVPEDWRVPTVGRRLEPDYLLLATNTTVQEILCSMPVKILALAHVEHLPCRLVDDAVEVGADPSFQRVVPALIDAHARIHYPICGARHTGAEVRLVVRRTCIVPEREPIQIDAVGQAPVVRHDRLRRFGGLATPVLLSKQLRLQLRDLREQIVDGHVRRGRGHERPKQRHERQHHHHRQTLAGLHLETPLFLWGILPRPEIGSSHLGRMP